jgi:drug/metabolite transporter (DMT)-like permease
LKHIRTKTYIFIALMVILGPSANILFKVGMDKVGALHNMSLSALAGYVLHVLENPVLWAGIVARSSFTIVYMLLLSWADYTYVAPVTSLGYALSAMLGVILLSEAVSPIRWVGVVIICIGVAVVGSTPVRTTVEKVKIPPEIPIA